MILLVFFQNLSLYQQTLEFVSTRKDVYMK